MIVTHELFTLPLPPVLSAALADLLFHQEALVNAQLELTTRPSLRSWRASQRRLKDLEAKLRRATNEVCSMTPCLRHMMNILT